MGNQLLQITALLLFLLFGLAIVDTDIAMQKKAEIKTLIELANHDATFAIDEALKTEGIIDLDYPNARVRFFQRINENGEYTLDKQKLVPGDHSVTDEPLLYNLYYVDFQHWRRDCTITYRYIEDELVIEQLSLGDTIQPDGGRVRVKVITEKGESLELAPKVMVGPSLIAMAYVKENPLLPIFSGHSFPVLSVEEIKF